MLDSQEEEVKDSNQVREIVVELLGAISRLVDWSKVSDKVKNEWNSILAKRVAMVSRSAKNIEEFVEKLLKEIAGDAVFLSRDRAKNLKDVIENIEKIGSTEVLEYLRRYPYLSVVFYVASKGGEKNESDIKT